MSDLSDIIDAALNVAAAAIAACVGVDPVADGNVHAYHCVPPVDCCEDTDPLTAGRLFGWWSRVWHSNTPDLSESSDAGCPGAPVVEVRVRYYDCWPTLDDAGRFDYAAADLVAQRFAAVAQCVTIGLGRDLCTSTGSGVTALAGCSAVRLFAATPVCPQGGCAGVEWRLWARFRPTP